MRLAIATLALLTAGAAIAAEPKEFYDVDKTYSFQYPAEFGVSSQFADGSGDRTGVTASSMENGDVIVELASIPVRQIAKVDAASIEAYVEQYKKDLSLNPRAKFVSSKATTMFGEPAADMAFEEAFGPKRDVKRVLRIVATVAGGKDYYLTCIYAVDKAQRFAPACDQVIKTLRFLPKKN